MTVVVAPPMDGIYSPFNPTLSHRYRRLVLPWRDPPTLLPRVLVPGPLSYFVRHWQGGRTLGFALVPATLTRIA